MHTARKANAALLGSCQALVVAAGFLALSPAESIAQADSATQLFIFGCGELGPAGSGMQPFDYRQQYGSDYVKGGVSDLDRVHTNIALAEMRKSKPYSPSVAPNFNFTLRHCPNHPVALAGMIEWELRGGNLEGFPRSTCYLEWAHRFAPDDAVVLGLGGNFFAKTGEIKRAKAWFERAIELDPTAAEPHYNYGLFLVDIGDYDLAIRHAQAAYDYGYPLPGLRKKLERAGRPIPPSPAASRAKGN